jgi:hypothetical protein
MSNVVKANDVGVAETGTLWVVATVEATGTGTHVQVLPLAKVEAPTSLLCRNGLGGVVSAIIICFPRSFLSFGNSDGKITVFAHIGPPL